MLRTTLLAAVILAAGLAGGVIAAPNQQPAPIKVGVVDLKKCFDKNKYEYVKDVDAILEKFKGELDAEEAAISKSMAELMEQMRGLPDRSAPLYLEKAKQLKIAEVNKELVQRMNRVKLMDKYADLTMRVYNEIRNVVGIVAAQEGLDLVLRIEEPDRELEEDAGSPKAVTERINHRVVLYGSERLDITPKVIVRLNQEYQKKKAGGNPPAVKACPKCKKENPAAAEKCTCGEPLPKQ